MASWRQSFRAFMRSKGCIIATLTLLVCLGEHLLPIACADGIEDSPLRLGSPRFRRDSELDPTAEKEIHMEPAATAEFAVIRVGRKIANESETMGDDKKPKPLKALNSAYHDAKKKYYAPKPACVNRTSNASSGAPAPGAPAAGAPPPPPSPPADAAAPPPDAAAPAPPADGASRRRKRSSPPLPFCDEINNNKTAPASPPAAPAPPPA